jgi:RND family efflux transporter MFP subunit
MTVVYPQELIAMLKLLKHSITPLILAVLLTACSAEEPAVEGPSSRPVKIFTVAGGSADAVRRFPALVDASKRAELAFRVSGKLQEILIREGDLVEECQLLAKLDPTDYQIVVDDRQATFENALRNFTRAKELIVDGNISRLDFDRMEAEFKTTQAALNQAQRDLEYTELSAPFHGRIAERKVENFEEVLAKQTVFHLQDVSSLDVIIDLPESIVRSIRTSTVRDSVSARDAQRADRVEAWVNFDDRAGTQFPLTVKEVATKADSQTQTFKVTFTMESPQDFNVLPGMTAQVQLDMSSLMAEDTSRWIPVRAVQADNGLAPQVWVLDAQSMTVSSREVEIGRMSGSTIEITGGLEGGEEIVAVGAPYLAEGMQVTRMPDREQAIPRADDPA